MSLLDQVAPSARHVGIDDVPSNAQSNLKLYYRYCEEQGVPRPNGILQ